MGPLLASCWPIMLSTIMMMDQATPHVPNAFLSVVRGTTTTTGTRVTSDNAHVCTRKAACRSSSSGSFGWARRRRGCAHPRCRPRLLHMQDFSSSLYWDKLYTGEDSSTNEAVVSEWHVEGDALVAPLVRLLGEPSEQGKGEELAILNVGCGTSTLWARCVVMKCGLVCNM